MKRRKIESGRLLVALAFLGFISIGLPDGLLGVAWPSIHDYFGIPLDGLGALLVMFTAGYLISSFSSGWLMARLSVGALLALSCLATSASLIGYAVAPKWMAMVALAMLAGLGAGAIDAGLNTYAATNFSARMVNWLHACYGIGTTTGPLIMTRVLSIGRPWQWGYAIVGFWQLLLAACFALTMKRWPPAGKTANGDRTTQASDAASGGIASTRETLRLPAVWLSVAVFFIYTGIEAAAGAWPFSLFTMSRSIEVGEAGLWVSVYWGSFTVGRVISGLFANPRTTQRMLRLCVAGIAAGASLIWIDFNSTASFLGLALVGLSAAPVFPTMIATTPERLGPAHTANAIGLQIAAAVLGQSLIPALVGVLARRLTLEIVAPSILIAAVLLFALYEALTAVSSKTPRGAEEMAETVA
jgi:fucose permease